MAQQPLHPCHQMAQQHLRLLQQWQHPLHILRPDQLPRRGDHNPWAAEAALEAHLIQRPQGTEPPLGA